MWQLRNLIIFIFPDASFQRSPFILLNNWTIWASLLFLAVEQSAHSLDENLWTLFRPYITETSRKRPCYRFNWGSPKLLRLLNNLRSNKSQMKQALLKYHPRAPSNKAPRIRRYFSANISICRSHIVMASEETNKSKVMEIIVLAKLVNLPDQQPASRENYSTWSDIVQPIYSQSS